MDLPDISSLAESFLHTVRSCRHILAVIKGSPDPDAIAAIHTFKQISEKSGTSVAIESEQHPSLPQNRRIIADLNLPIRFETVEDPARYYDGYAVFDHQSIQVDGITGLIPCMVHIDHHPAIGSALPSTFRWIQEDVGSTSTQMALLLKHIAPRQGWTTVEEQKTCTALYFGMLTDTDQFAHLTPLDQTALEYLKPRTDMQFIQRLLSLPFPRSALAYLERSFQNQEFYRDWLITGAGFVDGRHRDAIALIADFLLRQNKVKVAVVFALVRQEDSLHLDAVFRCRDSEFDLDALVKRIAPMGGGRPFKGAYQVDLSYFKDTPHPILLWHLVRLSTTGKLKYHRDLLESDES